MSYGVVHENLPEKAYFVDLHRGNLNPIRDPRDRFLSAQIKFYLSEWVQKIQDVYPSITSMVRAWIWCKILIERWSKEIVRSFAGTSPKQGNCFAGSRGICWTLKFLTIETSFEWITEPKSMSTQFSKLSGFSRNQSVVRIPFHVHNMRIDFLNHKMFLFSFLKHQFSRTSWRGIAQVSSRVGGC